MPSDRELLASPCKIGALEFEAMALSGGGQRRLVGHSGIGVDGQVFEDLGEDARAETLRAEISESMYIKLDGLRREGKVVDIEHPLFGNFRGRVQTVNYEASIMEGVDVTIILVEDGEATMVLPPTVSNLPASAQRAKSLATQAADKKDDATALPDWPDAADDAWDDFDSSWSDFDGTLDDVLEGTAVADELASAFKAVADDADVLIGALDDAVLEVTDLAEVEATDIIYEMIDAAGECVVAAGSQLVSAWRRHETKGPVNLSNLLRDYLGSDNEDSLEKFLESNPAIIDLTTIPAGTELLLPF